MARIDDHGRSSTSDGRWRKLSFRVEVNGKSVSESQSTAALARLPMAAPPQKTRSREFSGETVGRSFVELCKLASAAFQPA